MLGNVWGLIFLKVQIILKTSSSASSMSFLVFHIYRIKIVLSYYGTIDQVIPIFVFEKVISTLFNDTNAKVFQCEVCQLSKYVRNNYPL